MSEAPTPPATGETRQSAGRGLLYALYGAMSVDFGCLVGAFAFFLLVFLSAYFAPQLTPCTSAGGIPCAP